MALTDYIIRGDTITIKKADLMRYRKVCKVMQLRDLSPTRMRYYLGKEELLEELINLINENKNEHKD